MKIHRFLLTGGPGAGKSRSLDLLHKHFEQRGYAVLCVNESATELIAGGISPFTVSNDLFQRLQLRLQLDKEALFDKAAKHLSKKQDVIVFYDRGLLDGKAFSPASVFDDILKENNLSEAQALSHYDAIFHLESTACSYPESYGMMNNPSRISSLEEAKASDLALRELYSSFPNWYFVHSTGSFEEKMDRLIEAAETELRMKESEQGEALKAASKT